MFSTTLRIPDDLAAFLQQAAKAEAMSVNAFLADLLERETIELYCRVGAGEVSVDLACSICTRA